MIYVFVFVLGGVVFATLTWLWEAMTGQVHGNVVRSLDEYRAASENQKLLEEFLVGDVPVWTRHEIWSRMGWVWKETRGWAIRSRKALSLACLGFLGALYVLLWFKTLLFPNSRDLRILLGGRSLLLYVVQDRPS